MAGLAHQLGEAGAVFAGGGGRPARSEWPEIALRVEPGIGGGLLDQAGDRLVGQALAGDPPGLGDGAEQRPLGAGGGGGGPVEVGGGAAMCQPGLERGGGQKPGSVGLAQTATRWPAPCWSVFERRNGDQQAAAGDGLDVAEGERDQLGAAQRGAEAQQQHGAVPGAERRVRGGAGSQHQPQHAGHRGGGLAARADALWSG